MQILEARYNNGVLLFHWQFEFMQVCGSKLLKPNVSLSHSWTGEEIQKLARHGDAYITPTYEFSITENEVSALSQWKSFSISAIQNDGDVKGRNAKDSIADNKPSATPPNQPLRVLPHHPSGTVPTQSQATPSSYPGTHGPLGTAPRTHTPQPLATAPLSPTGNTTMQSAGATLNQPMDCPTHFVQSTIHCI